MKWIMQTYSKSDMTYQIDTTRIRNLYYFY